MHFRRQPGHFRRAFALGVVTALLILSAATDASAQGVDVEDRPIVDVRVEGVKDVDAQLLLNQVRSKKGDPFDQEILAQDIQNLTRLGRFAAVRGKVEPQADGSVVLVFVVTELPLLSDVQVVGNKAFNDAELMQEALLRAGDPRDRYLINKAADNITRKYRNEGYFLADTAIDEKTLEDTGILILRVREGPRVRVREVTFEGNETFSDAALKTEIRTKKYVFILEKGKLSEEIIDQDAAKIRQYYEQRGYLDVRVGRRIDLSDNQQDARVVFQIDEGDQYTVDSVAISGNTIYSDRQIIEAMSLKRGDIYSSNRLKGTNEALGDLYGKTGYIETRVTVKRVFDPDRPLVNIIVEIRESRRAIVGAVLIRGNRLTQDKVFRRQIRGLEPGRPIDSTGIAQTERRVRGSGQATTARVTVLGDKDDAVRDILVEVEEASTGSVSFGAAVTSDAGLFGAIDLQQRNFDAADFPESWSELFTGRAFRGAGQSFSISLQPGDEFQRYQVSFREPYLFDSDYFFDVNVFFFTRQREDWDEERVGGTVGFGKRFGDIWSASTRFRLEEVTVADVEDDAIVDARAFEGRNMLDSIGFFVTRSTVNSRLFPTKGTRFQAGIERLGTIGDFDFWRTSAEWAAFFTVDEDFLERKTVISLKARVGYIFDDGTISVSTDDPPGPGGPKTVSVSGAPLFERYYAGGHRTFRGFAFRGVGPRGIRISNAKEEDDPAGGTFMFLLGTEYNFPIYDKFVRGVFFVDSGTVTNDPGFDEWRVSVGSGIRLSLPFLGQAPFAFDFAFPLVKEPGDETKVFSFDIALPF